MYSDSVRYDPVSGRYYTGNNMFGGNVTYLDGRGPSNSANMSNQITPQGYSSVSDLYQRVLGRTPSAEEINAWNAQFGRPEDPKPINSVADLYTNILGREADEGGLAYWQNQFGNTIDPTEIARFIKESKNVGENISPSYTAASTPLTQEQISQFQQAAKPELQMMSQTPGYRPSSMMDQFYQPVYQTQYTNYAQPNYSLYGQSNPSFSSLANQYFSNAVNTPYAQNNYPINMGLAQPYLNNYAPPNMGGISNLMPTNISPYNTQSSPYATPVNLQSKQQRIDAVSPKFGAPARGPARQAYTSLTGLKK